MKKVLSFVTLMGLLSFVGCGGGDSGSTVADGSWVVRYSATVANLTLHKDADGNISGTLTPINGGGPTVTLSGWGDDTSMTLHGILSNDETLDLSGVASGTNVTGSVVYKKVGYTPTTWGLTGIGEWIAASSGGTGNAGDFGPAGTSYLGPCTFTTSAPGVASHTVNAQMAFVVGNDGKVSNPAQSVGATSVSGDTVGNHFTWNYTISGASYTWEGTVVGNTITGTMHGTLGPVTQNGTFTATRQ